MYTRCPLAPLGKEKLYIDDNGSKEMDDFSAQNSQEQKRKNNKIIMSIILIVSKNAA